MAGGEAHCARSCPPHSVKLALTTPWLSLVRVVGKSPATASTPPTHLCWAMMWIVAMKLIV